MTKLRIAIWHNLPSGGGKRQLYSHVKGLVERGHYVESWCPDSADQNFLPLRSLIKENVIPFRRSHKYFHDIYKPANRVSVLVSEMEHHCQRCAEQINGAGFDILYANACTFLRATPIAKHVNLPSAIYLGEPYRWFYEAMPELPWIAPKSGIPEVSFSLASIGKYLRRRASLSGIRLQARVELEYAKKFDRILVNSIYSRESVLRSYNLNSQVCYLGIDTDYYRPTGEQKEKFVVGLGTIYHAKGIDRAIRAVATLPQNNRPALVWIGNGVYPSDLTMYARLANDLNVKFVTKIDISDGEVISLLSRAAVMVFTSRLEPFGLAPLEANACGTTVVGIAEGGVRESIEEGVNGFLTHDDDPKELGRLIVSVIEDPQNVMNLGQRARQHVLAKWSLDRGTDNIESMLMNLYSIGKSGKTKAS